MQPLPGQVASKDYNYLLSQLLNGLVPDLGCIPYELWKGVPDVLKHMLVELTWIESMLF